MYENRNLASSRPDVQSFIVPSEEAEQRVLQRPLAPVIVQNILVVLHILRQLLVLQQSPLKSLRCRPRLLLLVVGDSVVALGESSPMATHLRRWSSSKSLAGNFLVIRFAGDLLDRSPRGFFRDVSIYTPRGPCEPEKNC